MDSRKPAMSRSQAFEASENVGRNASANPTMGDMIAARYNRRDLLKNSLAVAAIGATVSPLALAAARPAQAAPEASFGFTEEAGGGCWVVSEGNPESKNPLTTQNLRLAVAPDGSVQESIPLPKELAD